MFKMKLLPQQYKMTKLANLLSLFQELGLVVPRKVLSRQEFMLIGNWRLLNETSSIQIPEDCHPLWEELAK